MKKIILLFSALTLALFTYTSCTKDDTVVATSQGTEDPEESKGDVAQLLSSITGIYGYDDVRVDGDIHIASANSVVGMEYRFFSNETDLDNNIIKLSVYFPGVDSTYYLYSNPDEQINKVTYRSEGGNHINQYKLSGFGDLFLFHSKVVTTLDVTAGDSPLKRALTLAIAYTFAPTLTTEPVTPKTTDDTLKVNVKGGLYDAVLQLANQCGSTSCFKRDGYIHVGHVWLVWGSCTC